MDRILVGAIQMCSKKDRDSNIDKARHLMEKAVKVGAQLLALPENFSFLGDESEKLGMAEDSKSGPSVEFLRDFSKKHGVAVIGGTIPLKTTNNSKVTNSCLALDQSGNVIARYDKLHLFDVSLNAENTHIESKYIEAGKQAVSIELFGHVMGLSICYDLRFPELYRSLMLRGARVIFVPSAFTAFTGKDHWDPLLRARAIENQCYVVAPAQFGEHLPGRVSHGRTMIIGPWGEVLAQCQDKEDAIVREIDLNYLDDVRSRLPCLDHVHRKLFFSHGR
jgi:deaminated glutathione amidase